MDINDNQQINSFVKGMNTDVSDALMDSSQYRYAENVRLTTNTDNNSGELRLIEGVDELDEWLTDRDRPSRIRPENPDDPVEYILRTDYIMAMTSIRNLLIVVGIDNKIWKRDTDAETTWQLIYAPKSVSRIDYQSDEEYEEALDYEQFGEHLSLVTRWETDKLIKLYIADGKHPMMYLNLAEDTQIVGIENIYLNVQQPIKQITAEISLSTGTIPPAKVQYTYRFYKTGGAATSIAPMSNVLSLYKSYNEGYTADDHTTNKAVDLTIPDKPISWLDKIQIFRISYQQVGQQPEVSIIYDDKIVSSYTDTGYNVESSTLEDLLSYIKMDLVPKIIESKQNYLFAANVTYSQSDFEKYLEDNNVTERIKAPSTGCEGNDGYNVQFNSDNILNWDAQYWHNPLYQDNTLGGGGEFIEWTYETEPFYASLDNKKYLTYEDSINGQSIISHQLPSHRHGEVYRYGAVLYDDKGHRSQVRWIADIMIPELDNTFPWGTTATKHVPQIFDIRTGGEGSFARTSEYRLFRAGIKFTIRAGLFEALKNVTAVEIVRAERTSGDRICLTQGIVGFPYRVWKQDEDKNDYDYKNETQYLCPMGFFSTNYIVATSKYTDQSDTNRASGISTNKYLMLASPEICYQPDDMKSLFDSKKNNIFVCPTYLNFNRIGRLTSLVQRDDDVYQWVNFIRLVYNYPDPSHSILLNEHTYSESAFTGEGFEFGVDAALEGRKYFLTEPYMSMADHENTNYAEYDDYHNFSTYHCWPYICRFGEKGSAQKGSNNLISGYSLVMPEEYGGFFVGGEDGEDQLCTIDTALTMMDNDAVMHWTNPMLIGCSCIYGYMSTPDPEPADKNYKYTPYYPIGGTGRCMALRLSESYNYDQAIDYTEHNPNLHYVNFQTVNIKTKPVPYGGKSTITQGNYLSFGNIGYKQTNPNDPSQIRDTELLIFDGDCYPGIFNYCAAHGWYEPNMPQGVRLGGFYSVPIESDIDLSATYGELYTSQKSTYSHYLQDKKGAIGNKFVQGEDMYAYNTAYGASPNAMQYVALSYSSIDTNKYDTRVHHSDLKTNGEHIDNWLMFRSNNFMDVDTRHGEITNMRLFKDNLLYWQKNATGLISSNERTMLNDVDHNQIILGTGDVMQRYDYISTIYGMKPNQFEAEIQSNTTQYWWDGTNKEILAYGGGSEIVPLAKIKNCSNYINSYNEIEHPSLSYDNTFNEVIYSVVNNGSLVYNEQVQQFTSIYTFNPVYRAITNNVLHLTSDCNIYQWNKQDDPTESVLFNHDGFVNAKPKVQYVVNKANGYNKVFDITTFGGRFYGGDSGLSNLTFKFDTPLKQHSTCTGTSFITNREYDFRLDIPRNNNDIYGGRMRGKTMQCELSSSSNSTDFSLQYIITKYRMSWS